MPFLFARAYRQLSPYDFQTSPDLITIPKANSIVGQCGRERVITKDETEFYFILADVMVNNEIIKFEEVGELKSLTDAAEIQKCLVTNAFSLNEASDFTFSIAYGVTDSSQALDELNNGSNIQYQIELIDANTNEVISELEKLNVDKSNIYTYRDQIFNVKTQGLGSKSVKLRVVANENFQGYYSIADIVAEQNILGKSNSKELSFTGESIITSYDLFQNYPNPFNPSTIINYQIPEDGMVTLKIYDVLGNEIKTLVNEQKSEGRYEVQFDASDLASSVYIYKIQVNDFVSSKKMMLIR